MNSEQLLHELSAMVLRHSTEMEKLKLLPIEKLRWRPKPHCWTVLECLEHLNRYGDFYIPEINERIKRSATPSNTNFRPGWLGNYFAKIMLPGENTKKMKTFKDKNPIGTELDMETVDRFLNQQKQLLHLLDEARKVDLTQTKTATSISKWIRLRLGDTFRVVICHNERHVVQVEGILESQSLV